MGDVFDPEGSAEPDLSFDSELRRAVWGGATDWAPRQPVEATRVHLAGRIRKRRRAHAAVALSAVSMVVMGALFQHMDTSGASGGRYMADPPVPSTAAARPTSSVRHGATTTRHRGSLGQGTGGSVGVGPTTAATPLLAGLANATVVPTSTPTTTIPSTTTMPTTTTTVPPTTSSSTSPGTGPTTTTTIPSTTTTTSPPNGTLGHALTYRDSGKTILVKTNTLIQIQLVGCDTNATNPDEEWQPYTSSNDNVVSPSNTGGGVTGEYQYLLTDGNGSTVITIKPPQACWMPNVHTFTLKVIVVTMIKLNGGNPNGG
jgi:hypothetical protein